MFEPLYCVYLFFFPESQPKKKCLPFCGEVSPSKRNILYSTIVEHTLGWLH